MLRDIYNCLRNFLVSQSNIGHFERIKDWENIEKKKLEEIFETQDFIKDEIVRYTNYYFSEFILSKKLIVLDVGCSLGSLSFAFKDIADFVLGIDIEKEAIECANLYRAYKNYTNIEFIVDDAITFEKTKKLNKKFNLILLKDILEHIKNKENLKFSIKNLTELMQDETIVFIEVPNYIFPFEPHLKIPILPLLPKRLLKVEAKLLRKIKNPVDENFVEYLNIVSPFYIEKALKKFGFRCFNPVEDIKLKEIFSGKRKLSNRFRFAENFVHFLCKLKLNSAIEDIVKKLKLYPTLQLLCLWKTN